MFISIKFHCFFFPRCSFGTKQNNVEKRETFLPLVLFQRMEKKLKLKNKNNKKIGIIENAANTIHLLFHYFFLFPFTIRISGIPEPVRSPSPSPSPLIQQSNGIFVFSISFSCATFDCNSSNANINQLFSFFPVFFFLIEKSFCFVLFNRN